MVVVRACAPSLLNATGLARISHQVLAKAEFRGITEFPDNS
jgi:hypothetical protein